MLHKIALSALTAALYAAVTLAFAPLSFGPIQFRLSEAMTILPFMLPEAIPGLFVGCLLSNIIGGLGFADVILGSIATVAAAWLTHKMPNVWLAALPPVIINALVVGFYIGIITSTPILLSVLYIGGSEAVVCFALGVPLYKILSRSKTIDMILKRRKKQP